MAVPRAAWPALVLLAFSLLMGGGAVQLGLGTLTEPGPGFFPLWVSVALGLTSLALAGLTAGRQGPVARAGVGRAAWALPLSVGIGLYGLVLEYLGFLAASFLLLVSVRVAIERRSIVHTLLLSAAFAIGAYLLFSFLLRVNFPRGPLGF